MDPQHIKTLIDAMAASDLAEMEFSEGGWTLRLSRHPSQGPVSAPVRRNGTTPATAIARPDPGPSPVVVAPLFGLAYLRPSPDAEDFVRVGQSVSAGTTLCMIEAMKVFHEVKADRDATIAEILIATGDEVEAGQPLIRFT